MCMILTEMSMHEAVFPVTWAKTNVQSQLVKLFQGKTARYGHEEKFGVRRWVKQLNRAPRNHSRSHVLRMETIKISENALKIKKKSKNKICLQKKKECDIWVKQRLLTAVLHQDDGGTSYFRWVEKLVCSDWGGCYWEADWLCTFPLLYCFLNNLLMFKIQMQRRKSYPLWNSRPIKPIFCNYINNF